MTGKNTALTSALVSLGAVAAVAGCGGGGGGSSRGAAPGSYIPPGSTAPQQMVSAQLLLRIPARSGKSAVRRNPRYVGLGTQGMVLEVMPSPAPSITPSPLVTSVPTPGSVPTTVPIAIQAPLGADTFTVALYDTPPPSPGPVPTGYLLSIGSQNATVVLNSPNNINIQTLGVVAGTQINGGGSANFYPFENIGTAQQQTYSVSALDSDGNTITGPVANPIVLETPTPLPCFPACSAERRPRSSVRHPKSGLNAVTFNPAVISDMGPTGSVNVTATYPQQSSFGNSYYALFNTLPNTNGNYSPARLFLDPSTYVVTTSDATPTASLSYMQVFTAAPNSVLQSVNVEPSPDALAAGSPSIGCSGSGQVLIGSANSGNYDVLNFPAPTVANPTPDPKSITPVINTIPPDNDPASAATLYGPGCTGVLADSYGYVNDVNMSSPATMPTTLDLSSPPPGGITSMGYFPAGPWLFLGTNSYVNGIQMNPMTGSWNNVLNDSNYGNDSSNAVFAQDGSGTYWLGFLAGPECGYHFCVASFTPGGNFGLVNNTGDANPASDAIHANDGFTDYVFFVKPLSNSIVVVQNFGSSITTVSCSNVLDIAAKQDGGSEIYVLQNNGSTATVSEFSPSLLASQGCSARPWSYNVPPTTRHIASFP